MNTLEVPRPEYLNMLIQRRWNGMVKIITGIRRCGKSYLLFKLFREYLISEGVDDKNIICIPLDDMKNERLRNRKALYEEITKKVSDGKEYYVFLDEIQFVDGFTDVLNSLLHMDNVDAYVTGSNSKMLSSDVATEFRGRGDVIKVYPLSFSEFSSVKGADSLKEYMMYGGMPAIVNMENHEAKSKYLEGLFNTVYLRDIEGRYNLRNKDVLEKIMNHLCSSIGSLTNPVIISNTLDTAKTPSNVTVSTYIQYLEDSFLIERVQRYDVKGRKYMNTPYKFYAEDIGIRNAKLNFRQIEPTHLMENMLYLELKSRGYNVDVGLVEIHTVKNGKTVYLQSEIDFVVNKGFQRYYIQSAFAIPDSEKMKTEIRPLLRVNDSFRKIIVVSDDILPWKDDNGILVMGLKQFLTDKSAMDI